MRAPRFGARGFAHGTIGAGALAVALAVAHAGSAPVRVVALLAAGAVLTELLQVPDDENSIDPIDGHSCSFSSSVHIAAIVLLGGWAAALVAAFGVVAVDLLRGKSPRNVTFNASVFALATLAGGGAYALLGASPGVIRLPQDLIPIAGMAVVYAAVNAVLVNSIVALSSGRSLRTERLQLLRVEPSMRLAETGLGVTLSFFLLTNSWKVLFLAPLVLAVYQAQARLALLRRETARALETFANVVDERDPYTYRHSARVADYVHELGEALALPATVVTRLRWAGRLHDLGKIAVDARVLLKPGRLNEEEWAAMRRHPRLSARLLRRFRFAAAEARAVEYHHERFDGEGYYGVPAGEQPLAAHFLVVADTFDAMTTDRPYRRGLSRAEALAEIERQAGKQIHPLVARAFVAVQRGKSVREELSTQEWNELRAAARRSGRPRRLVHGRLADALPIAGVVGGLVSLWLGRPIFAALAVGLAAAGLARRQVRAHASRRLTASLRSVLSGSSQRESTFAGIVGSLSASADLRWAGVVAWREDELSGTIEIERALSGSRPSEAALTSWLIREAESGEDLLRGEGWELGGDGVHLAVPLQRGAKTVGFLVLALARKAPRPLEDALRACVGELVAALVPEAAPFETRRRRQVVALP